MLTAKLLAALLLLTLGGGSAVSATVAEQAPAAGHLGADLPASVPTTAGSAATAMTAPRRGPVLSGCQRDGDYEVCFSSPGRGRGPDAAVMRAFLKIFDQAGDGDSLRIAMFRWDIPEATKAIVAAQRRGAHVEIVADADMLTKAAGKEAIRKIEAGEPGRNVVVCKGACLPWAGPGPAPPSQDVNHLKLLLADVDGRRSVMTSSLNFEKRQYSQFNSSARVFDRKLYRYAKAYFKRLRAQSWSVDGKRWGEKQRTFRGAPVAMVYPRRGDLLLNTLRSTRCVPGANTVNIMIAVVQRYDIRAQIGRLAKDGCRMRVLTTRDLIENWLQKPFRLPDGRVVDIPDGAVRTVLTHDKVYAIHAKVAGKVQHVVVTGTSNSTCGGLHYNDEMMLRLEGRWAFDVYSAHVRDAFGRARQANTSTVPVQARCP